MTGDSLGMAGASVGTTDNNLGMADNNLGMAHASVGMASYSCAQSSLHGAYHHVLHCCHYYSGDNSCIDIYVGGASWEGLRQ